MPWPEPAGSTASLTYADPAFNPTWTFYKAPFNFNEGWHTVAAEWTPTSMTMLIDGKKIYTRTYAWSYKDGTLGGPAGTTVRPSNDQTGRRPS